ncbi:MAG: DNA polymerase III subunit delta [Candidatus Yanofskybacteria bacterium RIFCSPHIGHO2_01_FULL_45_42]|uniref:DNA-directed DNA polymerase n=1 Tax=Candidatus Yanofskybacteria bacterium RIFCSPHIGHO2_01_FULL_45_42 TaxID=1802671 RepID=A0A1F8F2C4_9BACT|nr:MAG: DNA polymerase III subunit delta [Candidatus Yanofskybacteria bacterium RIFCSPHIGHO2_01_FULL_45_42]
MNIFDFDFSGREMTAEKLADTVKSVAFFNEVKLVIARDVFSAGAAQQVEELIKEQKLGELRDVVLLVCENQDAKALGAKNKSLFKLLSDKAKPVKEYLFLSGVKLEQWVKSQFAARGCSADTGAVRQLVNLAGEDSWALTNETDKLSNFRQNITTADVARLVSGKAEQNIFEFTDALANKQKAKSFEILFKELSGGREPHYIFSMIVYQFRNLLAVKDLAERGLNLSAIQQKLKLHPFVARKLVAASQKFSLPDLKAKYQMLCGLDIAFKEGRVDLTDSLYNFVLA